MKTDRDVLLELEYNPQEVASWTDEQCSDELSYAADGQDAI